LNEINTRDAITNAIRFWERKRIIYNAVLAAIVLAYFVVNLPNSTERITAGLLQTLFVMAVLANIAFCAVYPVDVFVQLSSFRETWLRRRWMLFAIGVVFAAVIARFISQTMFTAFID
jgi:hypothetical protein